MVRHQSPDPETETGLVILRGNGAPRAQHRKSSAILRRRGALVAALVLGGVTVGGAAAYLGPGRWQTSGNAVALNARAVAVMADPAQGEDAATAMPELAAQPARALVPGYVGSGKGSAATARRTSTASPSGSPAPTAAASSSASSSPSPSATPSPSAPPPRVSSHSCADPVFTTSTLYGTYTELPYFVANNMWNVGGASASQTLSVCSASAWNVNATISGGGGVKTYPNSHLDFDNSPTISSLSSVTSTFADTSPGGGSYEDAYDIWLNGIANPSEGSDELMIWTDNHGQTPGGSPVTTVTLDGRSWTAWKGDGGYMAFVASSGFSSGSLNLLAFLQWVIDKGWAPARSTLSQVGYGVEIVTTNGAPATFSFSDFSVSAR